MEILEQVTCSPLDPLMKLSLLWSIHWCISMGLGMEIKGNGGRACGVSTVQKIRKDSKKSGIDEEDKVHATHSGNCLNEKPLRSRNLDRAYESDMANNPNELERLRNLVEEMEGLEVNLKTELLEYYVLKEQESSNAELQKQLKIKMVEIDMLNITINSLQFERKKLQDGITQGVVLQMNLRWQGPK